MKERKVWLLTTLLTGTVMLTSIHMALTVYVLLKGKPVRQTAGLRSQTIYGRGKP